MITLFRRPLTQISSQKHWFTTFLPHWLAVVEMELNTPEFMGEDSNEFFVLLIVEQLSLSSTCSLKVDSQCCPWRTEANSLKKVSTVGTDIHTEAGAPLGSLISGVWSALIGQERVSVDPLINAKHISKQVIWMVPLRIWWNMCVINRYYRLKYYLDLFVQVYKRPHTITWHWLSPDLTVGSTCLN